jgi:hypothetical protein
MKKILTKKQIKSLHYSLLYKSDPNSKKYRDKKICDEWLDFETFYSWCVENELSEGFGLYAKKIYSPSTVEILPLKVVSKKHVEDFNLKKFGKKSFLETEDFKKKAKESILKKYGTEHHLQNKKVLEKRKKTCLNRYGVEEIGSSREHIDRRVKSFKSKDQARINTRRIKTNQNRYGANYYSQTPDFKSKFRETSIKKYGVSHPSKNKSVVEKRRRTNRRRYGHINYACSSLGREKIQKTSIKKYGTSNPIASDRIKQKIENTNLAKYGQKNVFSVKSIQEKAMKTKIKAGQVKIIDGKLLSELSNESGLSYTTLNNRAKISDDVEFITSPKKKSTLELFFSREMKSRGIEYSEFYRTGNYVADFLLSKNLVIECDGVYFHSENFLDKKYHKNKRYFYVENGYVPLFFYEDEIYDKTDIVFSIINNKLGNNQKIYARKCKLAELTTKQAKNFFQKNHLMGSGSGKAYGLVYEGEIVSCIRLRKLRDGLDISRFCNTKNLSVVGGFSKLLNYVIKQLAPSFIQTFIDLRYGSGEYLPNLGFVKESEHLSFHWLKSGKRLHRLTYRGNSGYEAGCVKIWDCGQRKYVLNLQ